MIKGSISCNTLQHTATHCNTLQHTATHCNTLQHAATHCNALHTHCSTLECSNQYHIIRTIRTATNCIHTTAYCSTLQHIATHYNTLHSHCKHTAAPWNEAINSTSLVRYQSLAQSQSLARIVRVLQCVAVCCNVLQYLGIEHDRIVRCSVLQRAAICCLNMFLAWHTLITRHTATRCNTLKFGNHYHIFTIIAYLQQISIVVIMTIIDTVAILSTTTIVRMKHTYSTVNNSGEPTRNICVLQRVAVQCCSMS